MQPRGGGPWPAGRASGASSSAFWRKCFVHYQVFTSAKNQRFAGSQAGHGRAAARPGRTGTGVPGGLQVRAQPDATLAELQAWLRPEAGHTVGVVWRALAGHDLRRTKEPFTPPGATRPAS